MSRQHGEQKSPNAPGRHVNPDGSDDNAEPEDGAGVDGQRLDHGQVDLSHGVENRQTIVRIVGSPPSDARLGRRFDSDLSASIGAQPAIAEFGNRLTRQMSNRLETSDLVDVSGMLAPVLSSLRETVANCLADGPTAQLTKTMEPMLEAHKAAVNNIATRALVDVDLLGPRFRASLSEFATAASRNLQASLPPPTLLSSHVQGRLSEMLEPLRETFERLKPRNLRGRPLGIDALAKVMIEEGIPFFLSLDGETALALLDAQTAAERRRILVDRHCQIFDECEPIIALCVDQRLAFHGSTLREALAAYREGHMKAAQALATNVLDSVFQEYEQEMHRPYVVGRLTAKGGVKGASYIENLGLREWFALTPLVKAHDSDHRTKPPSETFTRNGTAHRVTPQQYTSANAVQAIMLATSVMGYAQGLW